MANTNTESMARSLLLGAVGDALGRPIEFWPASRIEDTYGSDAPASLAYHGEEPAAFSDDTQMTLFMAEGLIRAIEKGVGDQRAEFREEIAQSLLHWLATQDGRILGDIDASTSDLLDVEQLHVQRGPGNTCLSSCRHIYRQGALPDLDNRINDSKGCGAVMRSAPFGLAAESARQAFDWARDSGVLTHCHPSGYLSAGYLSAVICEISRGSALDEAMDVADELLDDEPGSDETQVAVANARRAASGGTLSFESLVELGDGWVGEEALAMGLACAMAADCSDDESICQTMWLAVRHSGDSDSTGSIAGHLIGAMATEAAMPDDWLEELELRELIGDCAEQLADASSSAP